MYQLFQIIFSKWQNEPFPNFHLNSIYKRTVFWCSSDHEATISVRNKALNLFRKCHNQNDLIDFEKLLAKVSASLCSSKKQSWSSFAASISCSVSSDSIWSDVRRWTGSCVMSLFNLFYLEISFTEYLLKSSNLSFSLIPHVLPRKLRS